MVEASQSDGGLTDQELAERVGTFNEGDEAEIVVGGESYVGYVAGAYYGPMEDHIGATEDVELELIDPETGVGRFFLFASRRGRQEWDLSVSEALDYDDDMNPIESRELGKLEEINPAEVTVDG